MDKILVVHKECLDAELSRPDIKPDRFARLSSGQQRIGHMVIGKPAFTIDWPTYLLIRDNLDNSEEMQRQLQSAEVIFDEVPAKYLADSGIMPYFLEEGVTSLFVVGVYRNICVRAAANIIRNNFPGVNVYLDSEGVA